MFDGPVDIPSFIWGCVAGPVGVLVVYLVTEDNDETKKALLGCILWGVFVGGFFVFWRGFYWF